MSSTKINTTTMTEGGGSNKIEEESGNELWKSKCRTLTEDPTSWKGSSLLSVTQITPKGLELLFDISKKMRSMVRRNEEGGGGGGDDRLNHRILGSIFFEPSTRTACSFQAAMMRLGGTMIHVDGKGNTSSGKKGESLQDTIRCLECYTDITVLRHPQVGSVQQVINIATKPVINAGDGIGEHPTQALLDVFTIVDELQLQSSNSSSSSPLIVVFLGDLKHGRTVHSLAKLLTQSQISNSLLLRYCSPEGLEMPQDVQDYISNYNTNHHTNIVVQQEHYTDLKQAILNANVLYVTRIQKERFATDLEYLKVKGSYVIDQEFLNHPNVPNNNMIIMHPLPRVDEISTDVDHDTKRAAYFRQMENGMYVRMALISLLLLGRND